MLSSKGHSQRLVLPSVRTRYTGTESEFATRKLSRNEHIWWTLIVIALERCFSPVFNPIEGMSWVERDSEYFVKKQGPGKQL